MALDLGVDPFAARGVLVTKLGGDSVAASVGIRPGDLIRQINARPINTTADLQSALAPSGGGWQVTIQRGDQQITGNFRL